MSGENSVRNGPGRRLATFKSQRDLSLGGNKNNPSAKKFVPNLNVRRKAATEASSESEQVKTTTNSHQKKNNNSNEGRKNRNSSGKPALIQTTSVFSEGGFATGKPSSRSGGYSGSSGSHSNSTTVVRSRNHQENDSVENELEKERLKNLLRDDFIDDIKVGGTPPIQLPMIKTGSMFKDEGVEIKVEGERKGKRNSNRILDDDEEEKDGFQSIQDLVQSPDRGELFLVQLPDILPGELSLGSCGEGKLGSIQVRASGQTRLVLENGNELDLELGTQVGFLQNAVSVRYDPPNEEDVDAPTTAGEMSVLGQVMNRLVVTPSWEALLKKSGNEDDS